MIRISESKKNTKNIMWETSQGMISTVMKNLAAKGCSTEEIAEILGVSKNYLLKKKNELPVLEEALIEGTSTSTQRALAAMYKKAIGGYPVFETTIEDVYIKGKGMATKMKTKHTVAEPEPGLLKFILTNRDPLKWTENMQSLKGRINEDRPGKAEADKINRLAGEILRDNSDAIEAKFEVSRDPALDSSREQGCSGDVQSDMRGETADNIQDDAVDVPTEKGTEHL